MNTNQFGVPNNLVKTLGLQVKCIQIWGIQIENYKSPEKNSRFFHKNSVFFFILFYFLSHIPWKDLSCLALDSILEHFGCSILEHSLRKLRGSVNTYMNEKCLTPQFQQ